MGPNLQPRARSSTICSDVDSKLLQAGVLKEFTWTFAKSMTSSLLFWTLKGCCQFQPGTRLSTIKLQLLFSRYPIWLLSTIKGSWPVISHTCYKSVSMYCNAYTKTRTKTLSLPKKSYLPLEINISQKEMSNNRWQAKSKTLFNLWDHSQIWTTATLFQFRLTIS